MKTLVVDDDPFALSLLAAQLEQLGRADVLKCPSARDALGVLVGDADGVDLVVCDLQMPDIDGVEFVRHLAQTSYRGALVLVSGEDSRTLQTVQKLAQAHGIPVLGALSKPVPPETLRQVLQRQPPRRRAPASRAAFAPTPEQLRLAMARGELVLHYQPKVTLHDGAMAGVEALVRWQHPQAGLVYPDRFITVAEEHGLVDELTRVVLALALRQARAWSDAGVASQVAVNVSMDNLVALDFPETVMRLADEAGVATGSLTLEVTESRLMTDVRAPLDILIRLRLKRVALAIDDFGTGHSSLAQLRDLPFDELKLDRSFVSGAADDHALRAIVEATVAMAHQIGMKTVAEGVEDRRDWDFLTQLGCDLAQGYFIARPMPAEQMPGWLETWERRRGELTAAR